MGRPGAGVSAFNQPVAGGWVRTCLRTVSQPSGSAHAHRLPSEPCTCPPPPHHLPVELCTSPLPPQPAAGSGSNGQLGSNSTSSSVPLAVTGGRTYSAISAGELNTCALRPDGTAYCWGAHRAWGMGCLRCLPSPAVASGGASAPCVQSCMRRCPQRHCVQSCTRRADAERQATSPTEPSAPGPTTLRSN